MKKSLKELRNEAKGCQNCTLWANATQTVFGAGDPHARVMLVGEQPADEEDRKGLPFVGPAGRLLDRALEAAGVDRSQLYVTNAVKHGKWQLRGKRRLHKTPAQREIDACHQWLEGEIAAIHPEVIVCLGATAAKALLGPDFRVSVSRGKFVKSPHAAHVFATFHPSALLRLRDEAEKEAAFNQLVGDLGLIRDALARVPPRSTRAARRAPPPDRTGASGRRSRPRRLSPHGRPLRTPRESRAR